MDLLGVGRVFEGVGGRAWVAGELGGRVGGGDVADAGRV